MSSITIDEVFNTVTISEDGNTVTVAAQIPSIGYGLTGSFLTGDQVAVGLTSSTVTLAAKLAMTTAYANLTGMSQTLAAGTWLLICHASVGATNLTTSLATPIAYGLQFHDGTSALASTHGLIPTNAIPSGQLANATMTTVVTLASSTTISIQGATAAGNLASFYHEGQGSFGSPTAGATKFVAVRLA
jgi:hypothetical protein